MSRSEARALLGRIPNSELVKIITPFNRRERTDRRILVNGRWMRLDPQASNVLAWLRAESQAEPVAINRLRAI
jgi:hypothetical protein